MPLPLARYAPFSIIIFAAQAADASSMS